MIGEVQPFSLPELGVSVLMILVLGLLISFWLTRKPHWSLFVVGVKTSVFLVYYGVFFDGTYTFLDDWTYVEQGQYLLEQGISVSKYPPAKPGALKVNRSKRWAQTMGRLKAAS